VLNIAQLEDLKSILSTKKTSSEVTEILEMLINEHNKDCETVHGQLLLINHPRGSGIYS
jgi:serine kinase of HPr protein (carbohydrate metabolism regulator)